MYTPTEVFTLLVLATFALTFAVAGFLAYTPTERRLIGAALVILCTSLAIVGLGVSSWEDVRTLLSDDGLAVGMVFFGGIGAGNGLRVLFSWDR